jgi:hypothetical protein
VAITAPYDDFHYIYYHSDSDDFTVRRRVFNYEYFEWDGEGYVLVFNMPGSTSLGGRGSRNNPQRTLNAHLSRGELEGVVTHPVFDGTEELRRFRLWNGGNGFSRDFMRDSLAQAASAGLELLYSRHNLVVKFVNGEFWGFSGMREHTSNRQFVSTHTGIAPRNVAIIDRNRCQERYARIDIVVEGDEAVVAALYKEMTDFLLSHDMTSDYARERFFDEFFCEINFMDYLIVNSFFMNIDWPHNNVRYFRAIEPNLGSDNPYEDGRWRFILHDMDFAPTYLPEQYLRNPFENLAALHWLVHDWGLWLNYAFLLLNNPTFAVQFVARAEYVLDNYFTAERLLALHEEFAAPYIRILPEMYHRFALWDCPDLAEMRFFEHQAQLIEFYERRGTYYREHLHNLLPREYVPEP